MRGFKWLIQRSRQCLPRNLALEIEFKSPAILLHLSFVFLLLLALAANVSGYLKLYLDLSKINYKMDKLLRNDIIKQVIVHLRPANALFDYISVQILDQMLVCFFFFHQMLSWKRRKIRGSQHEIRCLATRNKREWNKVLLKINEITANSLENGKSFHS